MIKKVIETILMIILFPIFCFVAIWLYVLEGFVPIFILIGGPFIGAGFTGEYMINFLRSLHLPEIIVMIIAFPCALIGAALGFLIPYYLTLLILTILVKIPYVYPLVKSLINKGGGNEFPSI